MAWALFAETNCGVMLALRLARVLGDRTDHERADPLVPGEIVEGVTQAVQRARLRDLRQRLHVAPDEPQVVPGVATTRA
jgi:hypothetical protein